MIAAPSVHAAVLRGHALTSRRAAASTTASPTHPAVEIVLASPVRWRLDTVGWINTSHTTRLPARLSAAVSMTDALSRHGTRGSPSHSRPIDSGAYRMRNNPSVSDGYLSTAPPTAKMS